jgi:hypothetical protein
MVLFHHEERQAGRRSVDISALPTESGFAGSTYYSVYDPFLVFEAKRLPAPKENLSREREYLTGGESKSGGVQRFKLGLHGSKHRVASLIGYIQDGDATEWLNQINEWIRALSAAQASPEKWNEGEQLSAFSKKSSARTARCSSNHPRVGGVTNSILIYHLWIEMKGGGWSHKQT